MIHAGFESVIFQILIIWVIANKIFGKKKLLFLNHMYIEDFNFETNHTTGKILYEGNTSYYAINFQEIEDITCVYAYQ